MSKSELLIEFEKLLPINDAKYAQLLTSDGLNGFKLLNGMSGNIYLGKGSDHVKGLSGDVKSEIISELNGLKGGKRKSRSSKKRNSRRNKKRKSRKNRRKSNRHNK